ncbi:hydrogenase expression/formation protein HypC [Streptosporangium album]|uniref:Hydrogenase expression/formation protein HypC n=1 Tax=Streptosporangium album TaxID=47479 RepID=A0A7W7S5M3_9ACTN|nr:HypC/HybG/HupF family hydrogenase formation chaperone [Streptosporangium album]MBB4944344.1 hydrogenase expression/formation protein HypC [Streptosporangium album]
MSGPADCSADACVTCSDEAIPLTVIRLVEPGMAVAGTGGVDQEVSVALVDAAVGDVVLVHAKEAIAVIERGAGDEHA